MGESVAGVTGCWSSVRIEPGCFGPVTPLTVSLNRLSVNHALGATSLAALLLASPTFIALTIRGSVQLPNAPSRFQMPSRRQISFSLTSVAGRPSQRFSARQIRFIDSQQLQAPRCSPPGAPRASICLSHS